MRIPKSLIATTIALIITLIAYIFYTSRTEVMLSNASPYAHQHAAFPQTSTPLTNVPQGMQALQSLLGVPVKFLNGHVDYAGLAFVNDPRYQALGPREKLVDAIRFQPSQVAPFYLLIAIAKGPNDTPIIVPGKFDLVAKTEQNGLILKDTHGHLFYYSGYILASPSWKNLTPGQSIQEKLCKGALPSGVCPPNKTVNIVLKKPADPRKDIPFLALIP